MSAPGDGRSPIRVAGPNDRDGVAAMLARAFADDPATSFIFPDPVVRAQRLPRMFRLLFESDGRAGPALVTAGGEAATLWRGPGQSHTGPVEMLLHAWPLLRVFGSAIGRGLAVANAIEAHHPRGDYWYLHIAGCDPVAQGRGFGGAAIRAGLDRALGSGLPAYLETATATNVGFYQSLGFAVTDEWTIPKGGPRFWSMLRAA